MLRLTRYISYFFSVIFLATAIVTLSYNPAAAQEQKEGQDVFDYNVTKAGCRELSVNTQISEGTQKTVGLIEDIKKYTTNAKDRLDNFIDIQDINAATNRLREKGFNFDSFETQRVKNLLSGGLSKARTAGKTREFRYMRAAKKLYESKISRFSIGPADYILTGVDTGIELYQAYENYKVGNYGGVAKHAVLASSKPIGLVAGVIAGGVVNKGVNKTPLSLFLGRKRSVLRLAVGIGATIGTGMIVGGIVDGYAQGVGNRLEKRVNRAGGLVQPYACEKDVIYIEISATKLWDGTGSAPDPNVCIDGRCNFSCGKNIHECLFVFPFAHRNLITFDIYDLDIKNHDTIAKGEKCTILPKDAYQTCKLDHAKIHFIRNESFQAHNTLHGNIGDTITDRVAIARDQFDDTPIVSTPEIAQP